MKKILLFLISLYILNSTAAFAYNKEWVEYMKQAYKEFSEGTEEDRSDIAWWFGQTYAYAMEGKSVCDNEGYFYYDSAYEKTLPPLIIEAYQPFTRPGINLKCFMRSLRFGKFFDTSDECILQRREHKEGSSVCWFDYKKLLPADSKIQTDQEFFYLIEAGEKLINQKYCEETPEFTTKEREECKGKVKTFLKQLMLKKAPHCRDVIPERYKNALRASKDFLTTVNNTQVVNAFGQEQQAETFMFRGIYGSAYTEEIRKGLRELGYKNFCTTEGFEKDIK